MTVAYPHNHQELGAIRYRAAKITVLWQIGLPEPKRRVIFMDDDQDVQIVFKPLPERLVPNDQVIFFDNGQQTIDHLPSRTKPFF